ncbi:MAG: ABC transporter permease [Lachnospiraceae bacterium]|nr:ABC transporter permease [Lachnospiraceae bacterium]
MSWRDILQMCFHNLYRRKGRTGLTVSGVVIGSCAIIIMVSLGIGMKESQAIMLSQMGKLTRITVYTAPEGSASKTVLDKKAVKQMEQLDGVETVIAKTTLDLGNLQVTGGSKNRYQCFYTTVVGVSEKDFEKMGYQLKEGEYPGKAPYEVLAGQSFAFQFADSKRPDGKNTVDYWSDENARPYFQPVGAEVSIVQRKEVPNGAEMEGSKASWNEIQKLKITGVVSEDYDLGEETSAGLIMKMKDLEKLQKPVRKLNNQKVSKGYTNALVDVKTIEDVKRVENQIKELGFKTNSMESIREPMEKEARQKQLMLGGLGGISLLVAAIGIANTMIMSITERTREIGIMKALGCFLGDIRKEFLTEAAVIGLIGGTMGIGLSFLISGIMNYFSMNAGTGGSEVDYMMGGFSSMGGGGMPISVIPLWLAGFSLLFSIFIGVAAGYYPAGKAVKISALEAMKG